MNVVVMGSREDFQGCTLVDFVQANLTSPSTAMPLKSPVRHGSVSDRDGLLRPQHGSG